MSNPGLAPSFWICLIFHEKTTLYLWIYVLECLVLEYPFSEMLGTHTNIHIEVTSRGQSDARLRWISQLFGGKEKIYPTSDIIKYCCHVVIYCNFTNCGSLMSNSFLSGRCRSILSQVPLCQRNVVPTHKDHCRALQGPQMHQRFLMNWIT